MRSDEFLGTPKNGIPVRDPAYNAIVELMGADYSELDYMGKSRFRKWLGRLRKKIKKRRAKRKGKRYAVTTPKGTVALTDEGISYTREAPGATAIPVQTAQTQQQGFLQKAGLGNINPIMLAIPLGVMAILAMKKDGKNGK